MRILKIAFGIILFISYSSVFAQELNTTLSKKENLSGKHQIGLSIAWDKDISLAYRNKKANNISFRANLNAKTSASFIDATLVNYATALTLSLGAEKHIPFHKNLSAYFGGEAAINASIYGFAVRRSQFFLSGLSGIKYIANDKIAFFAEAQFGAQIIPIVRSQSVFWGVREFNNFGFGMLYSFGKVV